jgi:hypothetical protein
MNKMDYVQNCVLIVVAGLLMWQVSPWCCLMLGFLRGNWK